MPELSEVNKFPHEEVEPFYPNFAERKTFAKETINFLFPGFSTKGYWKVGAFIVSNDCFMQAIESFLSTGYNGAMVMLRNAIDAALLFAYCYKPRYVSDKIEAMSYIPNCHYEEYKKDRNEGGKNWEWKSGIRDSIDCLLGSRPILGIRPTCQEEIQFIRDRANFSAHLMQRQIKALHEFPKMTSAQQEAVHNRIKWTAEEDETKETIMMTAKYLRYIRETYFDKFPKPSI